LVVVFMGLYEFGRALYTYHIAETAIRGASRYLARVPTVTDPLTSAKALDTIQVNNALAMARTEITRAKRITGLTSSDLTLVTIPNPAAEVGGSVTLRARINLNVAMLAFFGLPNTMTLTVTHAQPYVGE
jgi:hypothetical protein